MAKIPFIFRKTKTVRNLKSYMDTAFSEVLHTTLNPNGPGAIRIHLIPPKEEENAFNPSIAIINGTDILPVNDQRGAFMGFVRDKDIFRLYRGMVRESDSF